MSAMRPAARVGVWRAAACVCLWATVPAKAQTAADVRRIDGKGSYAVVVRAKTYADKAWRQVAEALREKHDATLIVYPYSVWEARAALRAAFPRYACFVATPNEAGRRFVADVHRLMRTLDGDAYTDAIWGILTGYAAADALRIARHKAPLVVRKAAAGTGINLDLFDAGRWYSESTKGLMYEKIPGGKAEKKTCPADSTQALVETLNAFQPDVFVTSGHATTRDWQIGYSYKNGQFRCRAGQLGGVDLKGKWLAISSPNPKVYLPLGNCLMGQIPGRDCMALAFMRTGGVYQMVGYTVSTWYGYGGWGVKDLFFGQPGRFSLAEAFYLNNQALVHRLRTEFPKTAGVRFERLNIEQDRRLMAFLARKHGLRSRDEMGLLWDRDTVALYGDPAWDARLASRDPAWKQELVRAEDTTIFRITTSRKGKWPGRPVMALLPHRVRDVKITKGADLKPLITDNFILVPLRGEFEKDKTFEVAFTAKRI